MKINYKDAINFIENEMDIKLLEYQKKAVKAIIENKNIFMPRCSGMSTLLQGIGEYLIKTSKGPNSYDSGKYSPYEYDVVITLDDILNEKINNNTLLSKELLVKHQKQNRERFIKEFDILDQFRE